jgi:predicted metal-dependent hydrolase
VIEANSGHKETLLVNGRKIPVAVVRNRRARRYVLRLREDGLARLTIPRTGSVQEAWEFAQRQGPWLERQLKNLAARPVRPKEWHVGTEILFRGERIKIEAISNSPSAIDHPANECRTADFQVCCIAGFPALASNFDAVASKRSEDGQTRQPHDPTQPSDSRASATHTIQLATELIPVADPTADLRPAIERHLRVLATKELPARTLEFAALHQLLVHRVTVRAQRSRWGSCSFKRVISLNWRLIQTPPLVRDYIILHELMHLRQMNHSARFWNEVQRACPDYTTAKLWLKENPGLLER